MDAEKLTQEILKKARSAKSAEELLTLVKECGCELNAEEAQALFAAMQKNGELTDEELNTVAGGFLFSMQKPDRKKKNELDPLTYSDRFI